MWEEESVFRTVYTWCMATHRESGLRRRKEGMWPLIRSTVAVFSQDGLDGPAKLGAFDIHRRWSRQRSPGGAVHNEWDMVKHEESVLGYLCETGAVACDATSFVAAACGFVSTVRYLVEECDVDPDDCAFRYAADEAHTDIVQPLLDLPLERGVDLDATNNYAFRDAAQKGHTNVDKLLLDLSPDRGPSRAIVQNALSASLRSTVYVFLAKHLAETDEALKRRKT